MSDPIRINAPEPIGEIVPGQPPVPITVWHVPAPARSATVSRSLAQRLIAGFTHPHDLVLDLTAGPQLARAAMSAHRRHIPCHPGDLGQGREPAVLVVAAWPLELVQRPIEFLAACAERLRLGGYLALVISTGEVTIHQQLVADGHTVGLTYLQHYVAAHQLLSHGARLTVHGQHLRVHTDVVVLALPHAEGADA